MLVNVGQCWRFSMASWNRLSQWKPKRASVPKVIAEKAGGTQTRHAQKYPQNTSEAGRDTDLQCQFTQQLTSHTHICKYLIISETVSPLGPTETQRKTTTTTKNQRPGSVLYNSIGYRQRPPTPTLPRPHLPLTSPTVLNKTRVD